MSHLFQKSRWWRDGQLCNLRVADGRVTYRGPEEPFADDETDLEGAYILPGFVDCHCHILPTGLDLQKLNLRGCKTREEVLGALRAAERNSEWLLAVQYDQTVFPDSRHITAFELDKVTEDVPVILRHTSGHACVVNTKALQIAEFADADNPSGGEIVRDESGKPTGLLLENAMDLVYRKLPRIAKEQMADAIMAAAESMSEFGITSAADMQTGRYDLEDELWAYETAIARGCPLRMRLYVEWQELFETHKRFDWKPKDSDWLRIAGVKLFADGAIGAGTAATYEPYPDGGTGQLIYEPEELKRRVLIADEAGYAVAIHSIGDRSTDIVLDAIEASAEPSKHRIEHAMLLSDEQIARIKKCGVRVTLQPEFLSRFGHAYQKQLGPKRAAMLKRTKSLLDAGITIGLSSDRPIVSGNPWDGVMKAANRGASYDASENITVEEAVDLYTRSAAEVDDDGRHFGRLTLEQFADFQVYESNPMDGNVMPISTFIGGQPSKINTNAANVIR